MGKKTDAKESLKIAGRLYKADDHDKNDTLSSGLAMTHEQVRDCYSEGEIKSDIDLVNGKDTSIPKKG
ncbi:DUF4025 domain-containing protein [Mesobacillus zeae]|uniref:DUF4025 domain-containing protein n=1 Tax=Mesobacillus zeae TaxID=1917180 RepID=A0A398BDR5_9BACI|nr:DUF4025 domain-containing protein [Mesobacillus zeae]RID85723.1 DUF4025 domain-containing protein [Mesobacillus zeae]